MTHYVSLVDYNKATQYVFDILPDTRQAKNGKEYNDKLKYLAPFDRTTKRGIQFKLGEKESKWL